MEGPMNATVTETGVTSASPAASWIDRVSSHDLAGAVALYAPDARFTFHIPGQDGVYAGADGVAAAIDRFFIVGRLQFRVWDVAVVSSDGAVAVRSSMSWIDAGDGALCTCYQSHHFDLEGGRIARQEMYCAGVRAELP
jgi:hypothetical protein